MKYILPIILLLGSVACSTSKKDSTSVNTITENNGRVEIGLPPLEETIAEANKTLVDVNLLANNLNKIKNGSFNGPMKEENVCKSKNDTVLYKGFPQYFSINSVNDTIIHTIQGGFIFIPSNCFVFDDAKLIDTLSPVQLKILEYYTPSDFILASLTTVSTDGQILQTGGTLFFEATQNGKQLQIAKDTSILLGFKKTGKVKEDMQTFSGMADSTGRVLWTLPLAGALKGTLYEAILNLKLTGTRYKEFYDGKLSLEEYVAKNLKLQPTRTPKIPVDNIYVNFDVDPKANVTNVKIKGSEDYLTQNKVTNVMQFMEGWKPFYEKKPRMKNGIPVYDKITMQISFTLTLDMEKGKVILNESTNPAVQELAKLADSEKFYVLKTMSLGWINCDRYPTGQKMMAITISGKSSGQMRAYAVLRDYSGVVEAVKLNDGTLSMNIPSGSWLDVITTRYANGKYYYSYHRDCGDKRNIAVLNEIECTYDEIISMVRKDFNTFDTSG